MTEQTYAPGRQPELPPPRTQVGVVGWLRQNLFSTWYNALLTVLALYILYLIVPPLIQWAFIDSYLSGDTREACVDREGACWVFIKVWFWQFIYGRYPIDERWRIDIAFIILILAAIPLFIPRFKWKGWIGVFLLVGYPVIAFYLFVGDAFGLPLVETPLWGGLFLTLVIAGVGIVMSLPIGVVLALGRRSNMPAVRAVCVAFIELWRGVPLITVLFMASVMFPLFMPEGLTFDKLLRALIGVMLFAAAYMAEVVRGGLQAIPKGQYEAA
ncbi:MAG: ABC transporter permease subunit, partial [Alphaproteobacteria bacterium]